MKLFELCSSGQTTNFCKYLTKHRNRIVNYQLLSSQNICYIGSGAVESLVKQIDRRLKISGAQWGRENINQMLKLRCAYLNELIENIDTFWEHLKYVMSINTIQPKAKFK